MTRRTSLALRPAAAGLVAAATLLWTTGAAAFGSYVSEIPNGDVDSCNSCHGGSSLSPFGEDFATAFDQGQGWSALGSVDSDGDSQTNGQELGDPCGDWEKGQIPARTTDISNPGDPKDVSADPDSPPCGAGGGGTGGSTSSSGTGGSGPTSSSSGGSPPPGAEDEGGCSIGAGGEPPGALAVWALVLLGCLGARRRR